MSSPVSFFPHPGRRERQKTGKTCQAPLAAISPATPCIRWENKLRQRVQSLGSKLL
jgi:hypothetical protein